MVQNNYFYIARSEYWAFFLKSRNADKLLKKNIESTIRKVIFNEYVQEISIETSAFCNRKCVYCPILKYPRQQRLMEEHLYFKILEEMRDIDYRGIFTLSLFNEPLADKDILNRIRWAKEYCPYSYVRMNSNGDYLTRELLDELDAAGLNEILITRHMDGDGKYTDEAAKEKLSKFFEKLGIDWTITKMISMHNISCDLIYKGVRLLVVTNNWAEDGNDRGGLVESLSIKNRIQPCCTPFREISIDVDGSIRFCFNIFVNEKSLSNILDCNIVDTFFSDEMVDIRRGHLTWGKKEGACETCKTFDNSNKKTYDMREALLKKALDAGTTKKILKSH